MDVWYNLGEFLTACVVAWFSLQKDDWCDILKFGLERGISICTYMIKLIIDAEDVVYTWKYGGPHILTTICANEMKLCLYNAYVL